MFAKSLKMNSKGSMLCFVLGIGYIRQFWCISPVSVGGKVGGKHSWKCEKNEDKTATSQWTWIFPCPLLFDEMFLTDKHSRNVFKIISRKYLQGQSNAKLIFLIPIFTAQWIHALSNNTCRTTRTSYQRKSTCSILLQIKMLVKCKLFLAEF